MNAPAVELRRPCLPTDDVGMEWHKHQCPNCGTTWAHLDDLPAMHLSHESFVLAHTCPKCGTEQYWKVEDEREEEKEFLAFMRCLVGRKL